MTHGHKARKARPQLVVAIIGVVLTALGLVPLWVPFLEDRPFLVGWLGGPLALLTRWRWVLFGTALLLLAAYLPWLFRRQLVRRLIWLRWLVVRALNRLGCIGAPGRQDRPIALCPSIAGGAG